MHTLLLFTQQLRRSDRSAARRSGVSVRMKRRRRVSSSRLVSFLSPVGAPPLQPDPECCEALFIKSIPPPWPRGSHANCCLLRPFSTFLFFFFCFTHVYAHTCMLAHTAINKAGLWIMLDVTAEGLCCRRRRCCCRDSGSDLDSADEEAMFQRWAPLSPSDWSWPEGGRVFSPSPFVSSAGCFGFFSLVLFVPPRSNRSGKKGKKGRKKKKKRNLFFWLGVNYFLLIISQKTDPNTKASIINTLLCLCVLARKKHFFGVRRKFFFTCESSEKLRSCTHSLHSTRMLQILFIYSTRTCVYLYFSIVLQLK